MHLHVTMVTAVNSAINENIHTTVGLLQVMGQQEQLLQNCPHGGLKVGLLAYKDKRKTSNRIGDLNKCN